MNINKSGIRLVSRLKRFVVKDSTRSPRVCRLGLYQGLTFDLNLQSDTQVLLGLWERETYPYIRKAAQRCEWAVDVGAGHGELCVYLLKRLGVDKVIAVEPMESTRRVLTTNLNLNGESESERIDVLNKFVGTSHDQGYIGLDQLNLDRARPGFIKIDVDGPECEVLDSGISLLSEANVCLLVETHSLDLEAGCIDRLEKLGYSCTVILNAWWRVFVPEQRPIDHNRWLWAEKS